jgi:3-methyladenine DNA glycosylase AlkC
MAKPLKYLYNQKMIARLCQALTSVYSRFESEQFSTDIFDKEWEARELKSRMKHISVTLQKYLPQDFEEAVDILKQVSPKFTGFEYMFFPGFVELYGLHKFEPSMAALEHFTEHSSSEFAVRPFILRYPEQMMSQMECWAESKNHHIRRLASEGCRPRLPWAMALPPFKEEPAPVLKVISKLQDDESEYVRRSVANNLNDIAKDHPELIMDLAEQWLGKDESKDKLVKHACRTLLKQGNGRVLHLFGFRKPVHIQIENFKVQESVAIGDAFQFSFHLSTTEKFLGKLRIEYAIGFMKKNGKRSKKVFKISESDCSQQAKKITKKHSLRLITTRKYYPGVHDLVIIVNGLEFATGTFSVEE